MSQENLCPHCGTPTKLDDLYCTECGFQIQQWIEAQKFKEETGYQPTLYESIVEGATALFKVTPLKVAPSSTVFLERQPKSLIWYAVWSVILLLGGLFVSYGGEWLTYIGFTLAGYAVPIILLMYLVRSDVFEREPIAVVAYCFGWGAFSGIMAGVLNTLVTGPFLGVGGAGFIEEPLKIYGVYQIAKSARMQNEFNDHLDGIIYGAAAGAGFAGLENFWYITEMVLNNAYPPLFAVFIRSITGVMHICWSAIAGRSLGVAKATKGYISLEDMIPGVLLSAIIHFAWNSAPGDLSLLVILPFTLLGLRNMVKGALEDERRWGFEFFAPDEKV